MSLRCEARYTPVSRWCVTSKYTGLTILYTDLMESTLEAELPRPFSAAPPRAGPHMRQTREPVRYGVGEHDAPFKYESHLQ